MKNGFSRRNFLLTAGGTAAVSLLKPSTVKGSAANAKIRLGQVGLGGRGSWIANLAQEHGGFEYVAVADYFEERAVAGGKRLGVPADRCYSGLSGYKRVIDSGVEAVLLETPPCFFPEHARAFVDAGVHVFIAKPLACDVPGTLSIEATGKRATNKGQVFLVDFQTRTDPLIIEGIGYLHNGDIGKIGLINSYYADDGFKDPPRTDTIESRLTDLIWTNDVALGGGMLVNAGIHMLDLGLWMNQDRVPVAAMGASSVTKEDPHGDTAYLYSLTYEFDNGVILNHRGDHLNNRTRFTTECTALCQSGYFKCGYSGPTRIVGQDTAWNGGEIEDLYANGARRNIAAFHANITRGIHDNPTLAPSVNSTLAAILGREAGRRRTRLTMKELIRENRALPVDLRGLKA